jgi:hypothetical protein
LNILFDNVGFRVRPMSGPETRAAARIGLAAVPPEFSLARLHRQMRQRR